MESNYVTVTTRTYKVKELLVMLGIDIKKEELTNIYFDKYKDDSYKDSIEVKTMSVTKNVD